MLKLFIIITTFLLAMALMPDRISSMTEILQFSLILLIFIAITGCLCFWSKLRKAWFSHKMMNAKKNYKIVEGIIISVVHKKNISKQGHSPYILVCQWLDKEHNKVYLFNSEYLWQNPTVFITAYHPINIYVDPNNYKNYLIDSTLLFNGA